jgi:hypothetical protein
MKRDDKPIMEMTSVLRSLEWQAAHAEQNDAPNTARVIRGFIPLLDSGLAIGERMRNWPGLSLEDAMPLRLAGGFHNLCLTGADTRLAPVYAGAVTGQDEVDRFVMAVAQDHDATLLHWLDSPPQTNEAGRSSSIMAALLWLAQRLGPRFELLEIGTSAGANTMIERYGYDLGGVRLGPADASVLIRPQWKGPPPPDGEVEIAAVRGCDRAPIELADPEQAMRLKSYCWPENTQRLERIDAVIAEARRKPPALDRADAADWVEARLAEPQPAGVCRVLYHSIVWQYLPEEGRTRIDAAMNAAGARADGRHPLAWIMLETNRKTFRHELRVCFWPGGEQWVLLGEAHAHGAWVEWYGN